MSKQGPGEEEIRKKMQERHQPHPKPIFSHPQTRQDPVLGVQSRGLAEGELDKVWLARTDNARYVHLGA